MKLPRYPDMEAAEDVLARRGGSLGRPLEVMDETGSTNDDAKRGARDGAPHGAVWVAEAQRAGRGRQARSWYAAPGESLLASVLLRTKAAPARTPQLSLVAGLAVRDAVARRIEPSRVRLKWPNDVLVDGKKVAGVLVESIIAGARVDALIVGFGVNVHTRELPEELSSRATSLSLAGATDVDRSELLADVLAGLDRDIELVAHRGLGLVRARLAACDALFGTEIAFAEGEGGVAAGIDDDGRLVVRRSDGSLARVSSGEVHLVAREGAAREESR